MIKILPILLLGATLFLAASISTRGRDEIFAKVTTTDGTQTTLASWTILADTAVYFVEAVVTAINVTTGDTKGWPMSGVFERVSASSSLIGSVQNPFSAQGDLGAALWTVTMDVSSNTIRVRVTGVAATTIKWQVRASVVFQTE